MRKIKKINGYLIVRFNDRELRAWDGTGLGAYGVIDAECYTGALGCDLGAFEYYDADTLEIAIEQARGLASEVDIPEEKPVYTIVKETGDGSCEEEVSPQFMITGWERQLATQIGSRHYPGINPDSARHELYGYKVAMKELGLIEDEDCVVLPETFEPERGSPDTATEDIRAAICDDICGKRDGVTQEELDQICATCVVNRVAAPTPVPPPPPRGAFEHIPESLSGMRTLKIYALGQLLEEDCPQNDCAIFLNIFRQCCQLDEQINRAEGWPQTVLSMELQRQYRKLEQMFQLNYAIRQYRKEYPEHSIEKEPPESRTPLYEAPTIPIEEASAMLHSMSRTSNKSE